MNTKIKLLLLTTIVCVSATAQAGAPKCKTVNERISRDSKLYAYVNDLANLHVYYGNISAKKVGLISKTFLTDSCTKDGVKGVVVRFQTLVKQSPSSAQKLFYCYSKIIQYSSSDQRNQGTFCTKAKSNQNIDIQFPYDLPSDPYSRFSSVETDVDGLVDEFKHSRNVGIDSGFDPFYNTSSPNSNGPDDLGGSGL